MRHKAGIIHVPMNPRFVLTMLAIDFVLIIISVLGMVETITYFTSVFWLCVFVTTIAGTFFIAGLVSVGNGIVFLHKLPLMEQVEGTVVGWKKEKRTGSSSSLYMTVYYPKISYRFGGKDHTHISNAGSNPPKYKKGDTVLLFINKETDAPAEKRDAVSSFVMGICAALLGGTLTTAVWFAYFSGWITSV